MLCFIPLRAAATAGAVTALTVSCAGLLPTGPAAQAITAQAAGPRAAIAGTRPSWAVAANQVSRVAPAGPVHARVYLAGRDRAGLAAYAAAVSTPGRPQYRHFLTPAQARARFGITSQEVAAVRSWLAGAGLRVTERAGPGPAGAYLAATGPLAAAGRAFGVSFGQYRATGGRLQRAPEQTATVPAAIAGSVLSITGLDSAPHVARPAQATAAASRGGLVPPCSAYFGQHLAVRLPKAYGRHWPSAICGYRPRQLRNVYGVTGSGLTGRGQTVAIVDAYASPTLRGDADHYARLTHEPVFWPGQFRQYQAGRFTLAGAHSCGLPVDWYGEQTLDVESLHAMAPGAAIRYVAARSCRQQDLTNTLAFIVNHHLASIVSDSWGWPARDFLLQASVNSILQLGITEGIGFFFSAGDNGYDASAENSQSARIQVEFPTSSPWATSVGGTSLAIGRRGRYQWETSWGNLADLAVRGAHGALRWRRPLPGQYPGGYNHSGGGGVSTEYPQPFYQRGVVPLSLASQLPTGARSRQPMRVIPDVSADANPETGFAVGQSFRAHRHFVFRVRPVGGTSLACPTMVGVQADAQQEAGGPLGFADPAIYARYHTAAFRDVTDHPFGLRHPSVVGGAGRYFVLLALNVNGTGAAALRAVPGYDDATGVGSPRRYIESFRRP